MWATVHLWAVAAAAAVAAPETVTYHYDAAGRLTAAIYEQHGTNAAMHYAYDANGNRTNTVSVAAGDTAFDSNADGMSDLRQIRYFGSLNVDGSADPDADGLVNSNELALGADPMDGDTDGDGQSDGDEAVAGTDVRDAGAFFAIADAGAAPAGAVIEWVSVSGRLYHVSAASNLVDAAWSRVASNLPASVPRNAWTDSVERAGAAYYRIHAERRLP